MRRKGGSKARKDIKENIQQRMAKYLVGYFFFYYLFELP